MARYAGMAGIRRGLGRHKIAGVFAAIRCAIHRRGFRFSGVRRAHSIAARRDV